MEKKNSKKNNNLSSHLKNLKKKERKTQSSVIQVIIKIRTKKSMKLKTEKHYRKLLKQPSISKKKINKIDNLHARLTKRERLHKSPISEIKQQLSLQTPKNSKE